MKYIINPLFALVLLMGPAITIQPGCVAGRQLSGSGVYGKDRILFTSEALTPQVFAAANRFTEFEFNNRAELWGINREIKHFADKLRTDFPKQKERADELHDLYKASRSEEDRVNLADALKALEDLLLEITSYNAEAAAGGITNE